MTQTTWTPDSLTAWRTFVAYQAERPDVLSAKKRDALTPLLREKYDDARIEFVNAPIVLPTPDLERLVREARIVTSLNRGAQFTARQGLAVSGSQTLGKSTAAMYLGRTHEQRERAKHSREDDKGYAPVLYVSTPPQTSPKGLMMRFASTLGLPLRARATTDEVMDQVVHTLRELGTTMVILDEVQHLKTRAQAGIEAASALKSFSERVPATFLYVGVDLPRSDFLGGAMGAQRIEHITHSLIRQHGTCLPFCERMQVETGTEVPIGAANQPHPNPSAVLKGQAELLKKFRAQRISAGRVVDGQLPNANVEVGDFKQRHTSPENNEHIAFSNTLPRRALDLFHRARFGGVDRHLHLHRFENDQRVAFFDLLTDGAFNFPDGTGDVGCDVHVFIFLFRSAKGAADTESEGSIA